MALTGQPRYTRELVDRLGDLVAPVAPARTLPGVQGHAWEQAVLPLRLGRRLLWSPSTSGPLAVRRQVVTVHDVAPLDHPEWFAPRFAQWYGFLVPRLVARCDHIITISEFCRQRIIDRCGIAEDRISVVPNGVGEHFAPRSAEDQQAARDAVGAPLGRYLMTLSSLEPRKNVAALLRAWSAVLPDLPDDVQLLVVGGAGASRVFGAVDLRALPPRVVVTGAVSDKHLPALLTAASGFVFLSLYEGFGLPPLEAMACGTPVLVADRTALPEVVGNAGLLVDPTDHDAVAAGLLRLVVADPEREQRVSSGRTRAAELSWDRAAAGVRAVLERELRS